VRLLCAAAVALFCSLGHAAAFPSKPIRLIVPFPPGGSTDVISRLLAERVGERFGQQVVVDNRPGASGNLGSELAARSAPDGHTIVMGTVATVTINESLYGKLNYDPRRDLVPLTTVATAFQVLLAHPSLGARSVPELIRAAKAKPGGITAASASNGTTGHLSLELMKMLTSADITHVPYKGSAPALVALLGGHVQILFDSITTSLPHIRAQRVRALGVTSARRSSALPDVQAIGETIAGFETTGWFALLAPAGTPREVRAKLVESVGAAVREKDVSAKIEALGAEPMLVHGIELDRFIASEREKWARVIKQANIRVD
jgi:tripartite-type tricarboxylate transporter receptor subunit TctC